MAILKVAVIAAVVFIGICVHEGSAIQRWKRSVDGKSLENKAQPQENWQPATGPREFTVNVDDNIQGANQHRHEKWNNGTVTGTYAAPGRNGKWLKYEYIGDKDGFRITSTKEVSPEELMGGNAVAADKQANININSDNGPSVKYTVTEDQLQKAKDANKLNNAKDQKSNLNIKQ